MKSRSHIYNVKRLDLIRKMKKSFDEKAIWEFNDS